MNHSRRHPNAIGNKPLIRLARVSKLTGCEILAQPGFMNLGEPATDRAPL